MKLELPWGQLFEPIDLGRIGLLVVLEALLSADNALILAIMVRHLPPDQRKRALMYGLWGAFVLRFAAILVASLIFNLWWLQLLGGIYLLYLPMKHFLKSVGGKETKGKEGASFWMTVFYADLADLAFAVDSVLAAIAVVSAANKLWVVIAGAIIGIVLLRYAANWCLKMLEQYPVLDHVAYMLVGWAGVKLTWASLSTYGLWLEKAKRTGWPQIHIGHMPDGLFWIGMAVITIGGTYWAIKTPGKPQPPEEEVIEVVEEYAEVPPSSGS